MRVSEKQKERNKNKARDTEELHKLFREIWDEREDLEGVCYCFETGTPMQGNLYRSNSCCYHHVLNKSKYPELSMVRENIVILDPNVHAQVERSSGSFPRIERLVRSLKEKYG